MPRPFTRAQTLQNRAFLAELARTGNARDAARSLGVHRATFTKRRASHPAFAAEWDAALAIASATLNTSPGRGAAPTAEGQPRRAAPAEPPHVTRTAAGCQLRRHRPGQLTRAAEQAFLAALSATANVRLAAAAAGFSHATFYARRRRDPGFAREMRLALQAGYERVEMALLEACQPESHAADDWRHNEPPPIPPMSAAQALQLLYLHQKEARLLAEPAHLKRRRGESSDARSFRLAVMYELRQERDREAYRLAETARRERGEPPGADPAPPLVLADLAQVTGWSTARLDAVRSDERALFGGWRIGDAKKR